MSANNESSKPAPASELNWRQVVIEVKRLRGESGVIAYDRCVLLESIFDDVGFRREHPTAAERDRILSECVEDLALSFPALRQMRQHFPNREQWRDGRLKRMHDDALTAAAKAKSQAASEERSARKPQPKQTVKSEAAPQFTPAIVKPVEPAKNPTKPEAGEVCDVKIVRADESPAKSDYRPAASTYQKEKAAAEMATGELLLAARKQLVEKTAELTAAKEEIARLRAENARLKAELRGARKGHPELAKA